MKKIIGIFLITFLTAETGYGQNSSLSNDKNYVVTYTPRIPGLTQPSQLSWKAANEVNETVEYFDGLGRPMQTVQVFASPGRMDIIQHIEYDAFGREVKRYLPYTEGANYGKYRSNALSSQSTFYMNGTANGVVHTPFPFAETKLEPSPLNRVIEQGAPGDAWQLGGTSGAINAGHTVKTVYSTNTTSEVPLWSINSINNGAATNSAFYQPNQLYKTIIKDENWNSTQTIHQAGTTEEFKDKEGRVVLKRTFNEKNSALEILSTYYVYDDFGNLRYVIPPGVTVSSFTEAVTDDPFNQFMYAYHYDHRNRLTEKKIPGKGWEYMVYNKLDQVVYYTDQRLQQVYRWNFIKYDAFGRVVMTGIHEPYENDWALLQTFADNFTLLWETRDNNSATGYTDNTNVALNNPGFQAFTINYYDDYNFPGNTFGNPSSGQSQSTKGLLTATKVNGIEEEDLLLSVNYYDEYGRVIQSKSQNHVWGTDIIDNTYSFTGELLSSTRVHNTPAPLASAVTIATRYAYDHMGRKKQTYSTINNQDEVQLSDNSYNELGQLTEKKLHNGMQSTQYTYNPRGWLKSSTSGQFSMQLNYEDGTTPQYNGNIANQLWGAAAPNANTFTYSYDKLNRLTSGAATGMSEVISYDVMGNITSLDRDNQSRAYSYNGNQLQQVSGLTSSPYQYDVNGNVSYDARNNKTVDYNVMNLPVRIGGIYYTYDGTGKKLRKQSATTTNYFDGIEYEGNQINLIHTEEGIARMNGSDYTYEYNLTDHLGNVRYSFYKNPNTGQLERLQSDDYYAFGLRKSVSPVSLNNKYLYNGKELQEELGQYDYGKRFYDPVIGRFTTEDPHAENYYAYSPYVYVGNNPLRRSDPTGMDWWDDVKKVAKDATNAVAKTYNNATTSAAKTYNSAKTSATKTYDATAKAATAAKDKAVTATTQAAQAGQSWVKENKTAIVQGAKNMQTVGDATTKAGYVAAIAGAPVAGVGATPGLGLAATGAAISLTGKVVELTAEFISPGSGGRPAAQAISEFGVQAAGEVAGIAIDRTFPGAGQETKALIKETHGIVLDMVKPEP